VPRRGQLIRVLYSEIGRILSHLLNVTTQAMDVGALTPPLWGFEEREKLMVFYERASGSAHARGLFPARRRASGPAAEADRRHRRSATRSSRSRRPRRPAHRQPHLQAAQRRHRRRQRSRTPGSLGLLRRDGARLGRAWDLRKSQPYECYAELDFDIPIGKNGDCYDRYLIRMEEMRQSVKHHEAVRREAAERRKGRGPGVVDDGKVVPPKRGEMKRSMEALIHHFKLYTEGYHVPAGEVYAAVEAPKGEFGVYLVSDGTNKPYRCKIRAPGFAHLQAMDFLCRGHMLADVSAILGSLDIVFGEVDR
jgi:NADH-quinone oxidoreductase subunit D